MKDREPHQRLLLDESIGDTEASALVESMGQMQKYLGGRNTVQAAVIVDGTYSCDNAPVLVLRGVKPAAATTYVLDESGRVTVETGGLPPVAVLRALR